MPPFAPFWFSSVGTHFFSAEVPIKKNSLKNILAVTVVWADQSKRKTGVSDAPVTHFSRPFIKGPIPPFKNDRRGPSCDNP